LSSASTELPVVLVTREAELHDIVSRLARAERIAVDVESNGLFRYRATLCTIQLATVDEVFVVDPLATPVAALGEVLGPKGPRKIIHDVAFDARILAESGLVLGNVLDTSIAARMVGRTATGLASLLGAELGITVDKKLQHHDWTERPIRPNQLRYLADDVIHLGALADKLWSAVTEPHPEHAEIDRGIADAIEEETRYRVSQAVTAAGILDPRPPFVRLKGVDRAPKDELPILKRIADVRENKARGLDVPPYKVLSPDVLFAIAKAKPKTLDELARIKGATGGSRARSIAPMLLQAVAAGIADAGVLSDEERAMLERPRLPQSIVKARRTREGRLSSWRKAEAKRRHVDEQVVLPGHCLQDLADLPEGSSLESVAAIAGIGSFRTLRDGAAILAALSAPEPPPAEVEP
jgi:ribonuclease D